MRKHDDGILMFLGTAYIDGIMKGGTWKGLEDGEWFARHPCAKRPIVLCRLHIPIVKGLRAWNECS